MVEQKTENLCVAGSTPALGTIILHYIFTLHTFNVLMIAQSFSVVLWLILCYSLTIDTSFTMHSINKNYRYLYV